MESLQSWLPVHQHVYSADQGAFERLSEWCMQPVTYLLGDKGKFIEIITSDNIRQEVAFPEQQRSMLRTALAILCLLPGVIIGTILHKVAEQMDPKIQERKDNAERYLETHIGGIEIPQPEADLTFKAAHAAFFNAMREVDDRILKFFDPHLESENWNPPKIDLNVIADKWKDEEFLQLVDTAMEHFVIAAQLLGQELKGESKDIQDTVQNLERQRGGKYCYQYFQLTCSYHSIRSYSYSYILKVFGPNSAHSAPILPRMEGLKFVYDKGLEDPYFTQGTRQYKWRQYYECFRRQFVDLFPHMKDERFKKWAEPDLEREKFRANHGTTPT